MSLQPLLPTKLDRKKLDQETTYIQHKDSASVLLNGVNKIYGRINLAKEHKQDGINDVINEVTECKSVMLVPNIDDHIFDKDDEVDNDIGEEDEGKSLELQRPFLTDLVEMGWKKLN